MKSSPNFMHVLIAAGLLLAGCAATPTNDSPENYSSPADMHENNGFSYTNSDNKYRLNRNQLDDPIYDQPYDSGKKSQLLRDFNSGSKSVSSSSDKISLTENSEIIYQRGMRSYAANDYVQASEWLNKSATNGHMLSQYMVANFYYFGKGVKKNSEQARIWYELAAGQGHAASQYNLGVLIYNGEGGKRNYKQAHSLFLKAAAQGKIDAQLMVASMYLDGVGTKKDATQARLWYKKAVDLGSDKAQKALEKLEKKPKVQKTASGGGVSPSREDTLAMSQSAFQEGIQHFNGKGVAQNYGKALALFTKSSDAGNSSAMYYLGMMYEKGLGTPKDLKSAQAWYSKASQNGDALARERMKRLGK